MVEGLPRDEVLDLGFCLREARVPGLLHLYSVIGYVVVNYEFTCGLIYRIQTEVGKEGGSRFHTFGISTGSSSRANTIKPQSQPSSPKTTAGSVATTIAAR